MKRAIKFPLVREVHGKGRTRVVRKVPSLVGLDGAALCAARMVHAAIVKRSSANEYAKNGKPRMAAWERNTMRGDALWARVFAGHITPEHARLMEVSRLSRERMAVVYRCNELLRRLEFLYKAQSTPGCTNERFRRIEGIREKIKARYNAITPYDYFLGRAAA